MLQTGLRPQVVSMMGKALAGKIPGVVNPVGSKIGDD
jgi:hypothetical protein